MIEILELLRPQVWKGAISFSLELTEVLRSDPQERQLAKALQEVLEFQNIQSYLDRAYMIIQLIIYIRKHCFQNCGLKKFQVVSMLYDQQTMTHSVTPGEMWPHLGRIVAVPAVFSEEAKADWIVTELLIV